MPRPVPPSDPVRQAAIGVAKETKIAVKDQVEAVGLWLGRMSKGQTEWGTHHAVLSSSLDNTLRIAQSLYHAVHEVRKPR